MRSSVVPALALVTFAHLVPAAFAAEKVAAPFDSAAPRAAVGRQIAFGACLEPPPPAVDMSNLESRYDPKDPTQSKVDPERDKRSKQRADALEKFVMGIDRLADRYVLSQPPNPQIAACIMHQIAVWARAGAMTAGIDKNDRIGRHQAIMTQAWYGAGVASVLIRIGGLSAVPGPDADAVKAWLHLLAMSVRAEYSTPAAWLRPNNNHKYWAGYFVGMAAVVFDEPEFFKFARTVLDEALADVGADGSIAKEMGRGAKSLSYQQFATLPIVALAVLAERNKAPLSASQYQVLDRLMTFNVEAVARPELVEAKTNVKQEPAGRAYDFAWIDMVLPSLQRRNPTLAARLEQIAAAPRMRPAWHIFLGGDVSTTYNPAAMVRAPLPQ